MGIASAATGSALAQQGSSPNSAPGAPMKDDPRSKYPAPPFQEQTQPWPGLAGKMTPKPDHGETTYKGSGRLTGRKALITGGDSGMGRAAAIAYAREGADVAINYLPAEESDAREVIQLIKEAGRKGVAIPGDLRDRAFCERLVSKAIQGLRWPRYRRVQCGSATIEGLDSRYQRRGFRRDDEDQYLCAVLDHQGRPAAFKPGSCIIGTTSEQAYDPSPDPTIMRRPRRPR